MYKENGDQMPNGTFTWRLHVPTDYDKKIPNYHKYK